MTLGPLFRKSLKISISEICHTCLSVIIHVNSSYLETCLLKTDLHNRSVVFGRISAPVLSRFCLIFNQYPLELNLYLQGTYKQPESSWRDRHLKRWLQCSKQVGLVIEAYVGAMGAPAEDALSSASVHKDKA